MPADLAIELTSRDERHLKLGGQPSEGSRHRPNLRLARAGVGVGVVWRQKWQFLELVHDNRREPFGLGGQRARGVGQPGRGRGVASVVDED